MRVWIHCLLMLLIMLANLSIAPKLLKLSPLSSLPLLTLLSGLALLILLGVDILWQRWLLSKHVTPSSYPRLFLQMCVGMLLMFAVSTHSIQSVKTELANDISTPIRVQATVKLIGISDSNFYRQPSSQSQPLINYRQLAIIESAEPLTLNHFNSHFNSNFDNHIDSNLDSQFDKQPPPKTKQSLTELSGKTILLSTGLQSLAKTTKLPAGFSTDFRGLNQLQPNQSISMMLAIQPLPSHESGFVHRWLRSRHINGQANILAYQQENISPNAEDWKATIHQWRWQLREHFLRDWASLSPQRQQAKAVTLSLFTGDRALINQDTKGLYQMAGISHLLAISGTHVLFLAIVLSTLVLAVVNRYFIGLYQHISRKNLYWLIMIAGALAYALFTGFDVPSARTLYMLVAVGMARLLLLNISARQILLIVAVLMAINDPYVLWQAGFWLSFVAVMLLISYDISINQQHPVYYYSDTTELKEVRLLDKVLPFLQLQLWIFIALLPLSLLLFGKVSLWGVLVNLVAIGLYGWVIVPLNMLAGILYWLLPSFLHILPNLLWEFIVWLLQGVHGGLWWLVGNDETSGAWLYTDINAGMMLTIGLILLPMLIPQRAMSGMWSLPSMTLLIILLYNQAVNQPTHPHSQQLASLDTSTQSKLTLLNSKLTGSNRFVYTQLLSYDDDNWLIVANHQYDTKNHVNDKVNPMKITEQWQDGLGELGVSALTGIIIQTPDAELLHASERLKATIPVGYLWLAGKQHMEDSASVNGLGAVNNSINATVGCEMDRSWQSDDRQLKIRAITGWQQINDPNVWACALQIDSQQPIIINQRYPLHWSGKQNNYTVSVSKVDSHDLSFSNQVILNAGSANGKLWQLWALLCPITEEDDMGNGLLLTHSQNPFPYPLIEQRPSIEHWGLLDKTNAYNQQKLPSILLDWGHQAEKK